MRVGRGGGSGEVLVLCMLLAGCGAEEAPKASPSAVQGVPTNTALAQLYGASCKQCHANPAAGAPLTGDTLAWEPRLAKGMDTLLDHSINGFQGMPPLGLCMQCTEADFRALIEFMAAAPQPAEGH